MWHKDSVISITTCYELAVRESNPGGDKIFRTHPYHGWGPPSLLYKVIPGGKVAGAWC